MKALIIIFIACFSFNLSINSQTLQDPSKRKNSRDKDKSTLKPGEREYKTITENELRDLMDEFNKRFNKDSSGYEMFPGSSRYYARRPTFAPYNKFFAQPDTSAKYYLIIKDPLTNTVTK